MMLKRFALLPLLLIGSQAYAGPISGIIRSGNAALANAEVVIKCGSTSVSGTTDSSGRYSVFISAKGPCTLNLPAQKASAQVFSSSQPTRHDFLLKDGQLRRR